MTSLGQTHHGGTYSFCDKSIVYCRYFFDSRPPAFVSHFTSQPFTMAPLCERPALNVGVDILSLV